MTTKHKCSRKVYGIVPCSRNATVRRDGRWWCWQHDPERVKADAKKRTKKRRAGWEAKMDREAAKYKRVARNARLGLLVTEELASLLDRLVDMAVRIASETEAQYSIDDSLAVRQSKQCRAARATAARIREALALEATDEI